MCNKAVDIHLHALEFAPERYMTQKVCDKDVDTRPPSIKYAHEDCKT